MLTIGQFLLKLRTEKNISITQLSEKTKINHRIISLLESEDFSSLPSFTYLKGFVKDLARALETDESEAENLFIQTYEDHHHSRRMPKTESLRKLYSMDFLLLIGILKYALTSFTFKCMVVALIFVGVFYTVFTYVNSYRINIRQERAIAARSTPSV